MHVILLEKVVTLILPSAARFRPASASPAVLTGPSQPHSMSVYANSVEHSAPHAGHQSIFLAWTLNRLMSRTHSCWDVVARKAAVAATIAHVALVAVSLTGESASRHRRSHRRRRHSNSCGGGGGDGGRGSGGGVIAFRVWR